MTKSDGLVPKADEDFEDGDLTFKFQNKVYKGRYYQEKIMQELMNPCKLFDKLLTIVEKDISLGSVEVLPLFTEAIRVFNHPTLITTEGRDYEPDQVL